jgi:hypothetical protein
MSEAFLNVIALFLSQLENLFVVSLLPSEKGGLGL